MEFVVLLLSVLAITFTRVIARSIDTEDHTKNRRNAEGDSHEKFKYMLPVAAYNLGDNYEIEIHGTLDLTHEKDQRQTEDPYSVNQNGGTQIPPWQSLNSNMFPTPAMREGNEIIIKGQMTNDSRLNIQIDTSSGTACQINVANRLNEVQSEDYVQIVSEGNEVHRTEASSWFSNDRNQYIFRFDMTGSRRMDIYVGAFEGQSDQFLETVQIDVNNLKMISASGKVEKLTYIFK